MSIDNQQLYAFLTACSGSWRNTIHIINPKPDHAGHLLAFDRDGLPVSMAVDQLQQLSGELIDPAECCGQLTQEGFKDLFAQYLLWRIPSQQEESVENLLRSKD